MFCATAASHALKLFKELGHVVGQTAAPAWLGQGVPVGIEVIEFRSFKDLQDQHSGYSLSCRLGL